MRQVQKIITIGLLVLGLVSCSTVPISGRSRLDFVPNDAILTNSFASYGEYIATAPMSKNSTQTQRIENMGKRLAKATDTYMRSIGLGDEADKYQWEFHLIAENKVNAFCMPGGKVAVYEGILPYASNDDQLATVISHEVAHAIAKHSNERMSQQLMKQYGASALSMALSGQSKALQDVTGLLYGLGTDVFYTLPYSRKHEHEADLIGLYLMALAGYDYHEAERFWLNMSGGTGADRSDFLSTHPSDAKRVEAIRNEIPKVEAFLQNNGNAKNGKVAKAPTPQNSTQLNPQVNKGRKVPLQTHY